MMTIPKVTIKQEEPGAAAHFRLTYADNGNMEILSHPDDTHEMNWAGDNGKWGEVLLKCQLDLHVTRQALSSGRLIETYTFTNNTTFDIFTQKDDIGIYTTFPDKYDSSNICMTQRCHAHIWCGGESAYIMGLRMGGMSPHLGLAVTQGSITNYSIERDVMQRSNHRGSIVLHPAPIHLVPGASYTVEWELFWHEGKQDFFARLQQYPKYIQIEANKYVLFVGEDNHIAINHSFTQPVLISVKRNGNDVPHVVENHQIIVQDDYKSVGEYNYDIRVNDASTFCSVLVLPPLDQLVKARCEFIVDRQQCHDEVSRLNGAYLIYDNEDHRLYYSHYHDHNGGRERFGMGVLIAKHLQTHPSEKLERSLLKYVAYIERELFDAETGIVYNDIGRNNDIHRLYNYSWLAILYMELFHLYGETQYLERMTSIMHAFYRYGGDRFYPILLPMHSMIGLLKNNGLEAHAASLLEQFQKHVNFIIEYGTSYPPSEVNYEQAIVAPAANILIQMYRLSQDSKYLDASREHLGLLELFNGSQPDYNLHEVSIRHWDGYWFGKRRLLGDTFPHYWSGLTGNVYGEYAAVSGDKRYSRLADHSLRGVLSLFDADGHASCARLFPLSVNGIPGKFDDPWANDQDWALYFMLT
jgi:hypothetical protein